LYGEHGTINRYTNGACRCDDCKAANAKVSRDRYRMIAYGRPPRVSADPVREHIQLLRDHGLSLDVIHDISGLPLSTIDRIVYGASGRKVEQIKRRTSDKILKIDPYSLRPDQLSPDKNINSDYAKQQHEELYRFGISKIKIAQAIGRKHPLRLERYSLIKVGNAVALNNLHWRVWLNEPRFRLICDCVPPNDLLDKLKET
jgi:hypothetical protein